MLKLLLGDPNARKLKRYQPVVSDINLLEEEIAPLSDDELRGLTGEFRQKLEQVAGNPAKERVESSNLFIRLISTTKLRASSPLLRVGAVSQVVQLYNLPEGLRSPAVLVGSAPSRLSRLPPARSGPFPCSSSCWVTPMPAS